jgi:hypothetical protein
MTEFSFFLPHFLGAFNRLTGLDKSRHSGTDPYERLTRKNVENVCLGGALLEEL